MLSRGQQHCYLTWTALEDCQLWLLPVHVCKITLHQFHSKFHNEKELKPKTSDLKCKEVLEYAYSKYCLHILRLELKWYLHSNGTCSLGCTDTEDSCVSTKFRFTGLLSFSEFLQPSFLEKIQQTFMIWFQLRNRIRSQLNTLTNAINMQHLLNTQYMQAIFPLILEKVGIIFPICTLGNQQRASELDRSHEVNETAQIIPTCFQYHSLQVHLYQLISI